MHADLTMFTYFRLAPDPPQTEAIPSSGATAIAYETVETANTHLPALAPTSEIAGRLAAHAGAHFLQAPLGGRGVLIGVVTGVAPARVLVTGGGTVGTGAARIDVGTGAKVMILERSLDRLHEPDQSSARAPTNAALPDVRKLATLGVDRALASDPTPIPERPPRAKRDSDMRNGRVPAPGVRRIPRRRLPARCRLRFNLDRVPRRKRGLSMTNDVEQRAMRLLMWTIAHLDDRVLELTFGSRPGVRIIFAGMTRQFVPSAAEGFEGSICYELRRHNGAVIEGWALSITTSAASASFGFPTDPAVTLKLTVGDFVRFSFGAVSPVTLLTEERLKLEGDLAVAAKLAPMFGRRLPQS